MDTRRKYLPQYLTLALVVLAATLCLAQKDRAASQGERSFLAPLEVEFVLSKTDLYRPQLCRQVRTPNQCPAILTGGWAAGGGIPMIEPAFKADLPNVRVSFVIQDMSNEVVAGTGVATMGADLSFVNWTTTGSAADVEQGGPFAWSLPGPGETWQDVSHYGGGGGLLIYDALVLGACGSFAVFPVEHTASIVRSDGTQLGEFLGIDNTTLDATGFYTLGYTVTAEDEEGNVSDFHFSGKVNVTCTGLSTL